MKLSVIIPTFNEEKYLPVCLASIRKEWKGEIIVVDGGSQDQTIPIARLGRAMVLESPLGLARQCNEAAHRASGDLFLFLSADCTLTSGWLNAVGSVVRSPYVVGGGFSLEIDDPSFLYSVIAWGGNFRSRYVGLALGDQGLFVRRSAYGDCGGMDDKALIPYVRLCHELKKMGEFLLLHHPVISSSREWKKHGVFSTTWNHVRTYRRFHIDH